MSVRPLLAVSLALAVAACGDDGGAAPDASVDGAAARSTVLFLNFDGAALTRGIPDDPAANVSSLIRPEGATVPPWRDGEPGRTTSVATIAAGVRSVLAPYDIVVVTTRPLAGPYDMILFGGHARDLFGAGPIDVHGGGDCTFDNPDISFVTESVTDDEVAANLAIGAFAHAHDLPRIASAAHCNCEPAGSCLPYTGDLCVIGGAGTMTTGTRCPDATWPATVDEHALFVERFGALP